MFMIRKHDSLLFNNIAFFSLFFSLPSVLINVYTVDPDMRPVNEKVIPSLCQIEATKMCISRWFTVKQ